MRASVRELFETAILALFVFAILQISVQNYRVEGPSMLPNLVDGEHVLVNKMVYAKFHSSQLMSKLPFSNLVDGDLVYPFHPPRRGDVIIFHFPRNEAHDFVKRVIGLAGDTVEIDAGQVMVNGIPLSEPYITKHDQSDMHPVRIPEDHFFVLGDNRSASNASRNWGLVPADNIVGQAWVAYWPPSHWRALNLEF